MEMIRGFAWPVPLAFAPAVAACRFEQGDLLYSSPDAYVAWTAAEPAAPRAPVWAIQVLAPARSTRIAASEDSGKRFFASWDTDVEVELWMGAAEANAELRTTTQGRLFSCLWRGDPDVLDTASEPPEPPLLQRDLHGRLAEALPALRDRLGAAGSGEAGCLYAAAVDQASESSRTKAHAIEAVLAERFAVTRLDLSPLEAGLEGGARFHPALTMRGLWVAGSRPADVEEMLKSLLYTASAGKADRFSLSRHGVLEDGEAA